MKKYYWVMIISIPLLLLMAVGLFYAGKLLQLRPLADKLSFALSSKEGITEKIRCWEEDDSGELIVFLPSYAELDALTTDIAGNEEIKIDGTVIKRGMNCSRYALNTKYSISDGRNDTTICFLKSANVATMYIDTESGNMDNIHRDKSQKENAEILLLTERGELDYRGEGFDQIRGHGNSTWEDDKKPYNVYLTKEANLLKMGQGSKWVLLSNCYDYSNIRNKMILDLADQVASFDGFSPHTAYVDLYLNGEYAGLYLLAEHVSNFYNTEVLSEQCVLFGTDWDGIDDYEFFINPGFVVTVVIPKPITKAHSWDLEMAVMQFQESVLTEDSEDTHWMDYIDMDSWARKYLIEEIFMNNDAGTTSQYYIWNNLENRIYAGPCWDYDDVLGQYLPPSPCSFLANREWASNHSYTPWFHALLKKPEFKEKVIALYKDVYLPKLKWLLNTGMTQYERRIHQAGLLNQIRWNLIDQEEETELIKDFLDERVSFLNSAWIDGKVYHTVTIKGLGSHRFFSILDGEDGSGVPSPADMPLPDKFNAIVENIWYYEDTDKPFNPDTVISEDITLYAKTHEVKSAPKAKKIHMDRYITVFTMLIMIVILCIMVYGEFGQNLSGRRRGKHGQR